MQRLQDYIDSFKSTLSTEILVTAEMRRKAKFIVMSVEDERVPREVRESLRTKNGGKKKGSEYSHSQVIEVDPVWGKEGYLPVNDASELYIVFEFKEVRGNKLVAKAVAMVSPFKGKTSYHPWAETIAARLLEGIGQPTEIIYELPETVFEFDHRKLPEGMSTYVDFTAGELVFVTGKMLKSEAEQGLAAWLVLLAQQLDMELVFRLVNEK